ncbi:WecB/TagA/CpsF family glycosyltransferase [Candidatus Peregrinibacteria bacterium]|nr:WecB/TagA/CpsF family glycosyltransferase [Candidatus Peregrinibacteria bacterium]
MKKVKVLNIQFDVCTKDEALARILDALQNRSRESAKHIVTPNPEMLLHAQNNASFRETLNRAWLSIPDGIGILWASTFQEITKRSGAIGRLLKGLASLIGLIFFPGSCQRVFSERITGVDLMESICAVSRDKKTPIFLLGAIVGVAEKAKEILEIRYPGVNIVGTFSGSPNDFDFAAINALIAETQPEILFIAYGAPAQELWISRHIAKFPSVKIAMGVGGAFDFLSGLKKRAPKLMQKLGLEWLYRLLKEPSRWKRIWNAIVKFPLRVIRS